MKRKPTTAHKLANVARRANHDAYVAALRDGRKNRATTFVDRKAKASKDACRKGNW